MSFFKDSALRTLFNRVIKDKLTTEATTIKVVTEDPLLLSALDEHQKTAAVCLAAVNQNGLALSFVPVVERTLTVCTAAVTDNGLALEFCPETFSTPDRRTLEEAAVTNTYSALQFCTTIDDALINIAFS